MTGIPVPAALNPIIGSLTLISHNFLSFWASLNVFVNFVGIGAIILLLTNALTNLSAVFSNKVFFQKFGSKIFRLLFSKIEYILPFSKVLLYSEVNFFNFWSNIKKFTFH